MDNHAAILQAAYLELCEKYDALLDDYGVLLDENARLIDENIILSAMVAKLQLEKEDK